jgi:predicted double-glycine peptidase
VLLGVGGWGHRASAASHGPVTSLVEVRQRNVVVQEWDLSCGAAALATLLTYQHGDPVSEREVALGLINRQEYLADPSLLRKREGFSLLDLERLAASRGYKGIGYGQLTFDHLLAKAPIIIPVQLYGFNHFVIFRGLASNRVLLADPAFGNRTMTRDRFEQAWIEAPELGHVGFVVVRRDGLIPPNRLAPQLDEFLALQ